MHDRARLRVETWRLLEKIFGERNDRLLAVAERDPPFVRPMVCESWGWDRSSSSTSTMSSENLETFESRTACVHAWLGTGSLVRSNSGISLGGGNRR